MGLLKKIGQVGGAVSGFMTAGPVAAYLGSKLGGAAGEVASGDKKLGDIFGTSGYNVQLDPYAAQQQVSLAQALQKRISGEVPSYAETATSNALKENLLAQQQGIRSIGGVSGALKQRMIANAAARGGSEIARRGGEAALQERNDAYGQLGTVLNQIRGGGQQEEAMRQGAFESKQAGKRQLWAAAGQGVGSFLGGKGVSPARSAPEGYDYDDDSRR